MTRPARRHTIRFGCRFARLPTALCLAAALAVGGCSPDKDRQSDGDGRTLKVKQGGQPPEGPVDKPEPPLNVAARAGDVAAVRVLIEGGAEVNAFGDDRKTALMAAAEANQRDVVKVLLERGADANLRDAKGQTAAQIAEEKGHTEVMQLLERKEVKPPPIDAEPADPPANP